MFRFQPLDQSTAQSPVSSSTKILTMIQSQTDGEPTALLYRGSGSGFAGINLQEGEALSQSFVKNAGLWSKPLTKLIICEVSVLWEVLGLQRARGPCSGPRNGSECIIKRM